MKRGRERRDVRQAFRKERGNNVCRARAPVVAGEREPLQAERVGGVDRVLRERDGGGDAGRRVVEEARRGEAAQVGCERTEACVVQTLRDRVPRARVVGPAVHE